MDKRIVLAVAGSGKTTEIIKRLSENDRSLIVTYTQENYKILADEIISKFGYLPNGIKVYTFFSFLYSFCFKPYKPNKYIEGISYKEFNTFGIKDTDLRYYANQYSRRMYHARLSKFCNKFLLKEIIARLERYFDFLYIDEIQDISGHDFNFIIDLLQCNLNIFLTGDFYQHNYDTSRDGNVNGNLFNDYDKYIKKFGDNGIVIDKQMLSKSWRCTPDICQFITDNLNIRIESHRNNNSFIKELEADVEIENICTNNKIIKLFYQNSSKYDLYSDNWGNSKGKTFEENICVVLNAKTYNLYKKEKLLDLAPTTRNKLYVAFTRTKGGIYIIEEKKVKKFMFDN